MLGHRRDPVHPFSDAGMLAEEMPNARLIEADSLVELRLQPERLTDEIAAFLDEVWRARAAGRARRAQGRTAAQTPRAARARPARSRAPGSRLARREQFDFVDAHVAGRLRRCRRPTAGPLIHSVDEAEGLASGLRSLMRVWRSS